MEKDGAVQLEIPPCDILTSTPSVQYPDAKGFLQLVNRNNPVRDERPGALVMIAEAVGDKAVIQNSDMSINEEAGKWLAENACEYGFIIRYPKNKEHITGVIYEPWHIRYVGRKDAETIYERGICLEEYPGEAVL